MARILVTEEISDAGLELLRAAGHEVDVRLGLDADGLLEAVADADALIVRSATRVTEAVLAAAPRLTVVGRAGTGVDNIDLEAATARGVMVVNAPTSNSISAAEHALALMLAQARNIPQAHAALVAGRWERSRWAGVELAGKTLGIIGFGRIGRLVAQRALAFGMRVIAHDPYVSAERARQVNVELVDLDRLMAESDFVTIHAAKTAESTGLIDAAMLARAKPGMRIVNVARGGIVDEEALHDALRSGRIAGAALDVFATEPCTDSPLFGLPNVVVTPHLGASTVEAQDRAGVVIAEQVLAALAGELVANAVNVAATEVSEAVRPFLGLAEQLGRIFGALVGGSPGALEVTVTGQLAEEDTRILTLAALKGLLAPTTEDPVTYVNAPALAAERGIEIREIRSATAHEYVNLVGLRGGGHAVAGTLVPPAGRPKIVMLDDHDVEVPPAEHMLVIRNRDVPGMIGRVGTLLGEAGVNISDMHLGRSPEGERALMLVSTDAHVPDGVLEALRAVDGILSVHRIG